MLNSCRPTDAHKKAVNWSNIIKRRPDQPKPDCRHIQERLTKIEIHLKRGRGIGRRQTGVTWDDYGPTRFKVKFKDKIDIPFALSYFETEHIFLLPICKTKLICSLAGIYFTFVMFLCASSLVSSVIVIYMHNRSSAKHSLAMPTWVSLLLSDITGFIIT